MFNSSPVTLSLRTIGVRAAIRPPFGAPSNRRFADLINSWEPIAHENEARRGVLANLNRVVHDYFHASGENEFDR